MYISGNKYNIINRLHQLPTGTIDLSTFRSEISGYTFSGIADFHVVDKINNELGYKYFIFTRNPIFINQNYVSWTSGLSNQGVIWSNSYIRRFLFNNTSDRLADSGDVGRTATGISGIISYTNDVANLNTGQIINLGRMDYLGTMLNNEKIVWEADLTISDSTTRRIFGTENLINNVGDLWFIYLNAIRTGGSVATTNISGGLYTLFKINGVEAWASITGTTIADQNSHNLRIEVDAYNSGINFYLDNNLLTSNKFSNYSGFAEICTGFNRDFYFGAFNDAGGIVGYLSGTVDNLGIYRIGKNNSKNGLRYNFGTTTKITSLDDNKYNAFPMVGVWRKADSYYGRIATFYRESVTHTDFNGAIKCTWSDDGGTTWASPQLVISGTYPIDYREGAVQERPNGGLFLGLGWRTTGNGTGNAELYDVSWGATGNPVLTTAGVMYPPNDGLYERIKHCTSVIEVSNNNWLAAAGSINTGGYSVDAIIWKSIDQGTTWSIHTKPATQSGIGTQQAECALVNDPVSSTKLWFHVRDTTTEDKIRRWYSTDYPNYNTWTYHSMSRGNYGSPRARVIDNVMWCGWRDSGPSNHCNVLFSIDGENLHTIGKITKEVSSLVNNGVMTYAQMVENISGQLLMVFGSDATSTNCDILITRVNPI